MIVYKYKPKIEGVDSLSVQEAERNYNRLKTLVGIAGFIMLVCMFSGSKNGLTISFWFVIFLSLALAYNHEKIMKCQKTQKYIDLVIKQKLTAIENIAAAIPTGYEIAEYDLQKIIDQGLLTDAYIDRTNREIILKEKPSKLTQIDQAAKRPVTCRNCGATISIAVGETDECEYCGSLIE